jgi:hypothetical protein
VDAPEDGVAKPQLEEAELIEDVGFFFVQGRRGEGVVGEWRVVVGLGSIGAFALCLVVLGLGGLGGIPGSARAGFRA